MASFNKWIGVGNVTRDVEMRYTGGGEPIAQIGLAVNRRYKTKDNEQREEVLFIDVTFFGRSAENLQKLVRKGDPLMVEGSLRLESWESKSGEKRTKITVRGENFQIFNFHDDDGNSRPATQARPPGSEPSGRPDGQRKEDDDIPF